MQAGDVRGASEPAEGDAADELLFYLFGHRVEHLRFDGARGYAVDAHRVAGELLGERSRQADDPGLAGRVVRLAPVAEGGDGGRVGDGPAAAFAQVGNESPAGDEGAGEIDLDDPSPVLIGELRGEPIGDDAGVVHEDVGHSCPGDQLFEGGLDGAGIADVNGSAGDPLVVFCRGVLTVGIPDLYTGALGAKEAGGRGADAPRSSGNDGDPVFKQHSGLPAGEPGFLENQGEALLDRQPGDEKDPVVARAVVCEQDLVNTPGLLGRLRPMGCRLVVRPGIEEEYAAASLAGLRPGIEELFEGLQPVVAQVAETISDSTV